MAACPSGDPYCPCQDGDACHYAGRDPFPMLEQRMTQVREHRGNLDDSLATTRTVADLDELERVIAETLAPFGVTVRPEDLQIMPYGFDERIGWDVHLIYLRGYGVWGMADGPIA